MERFIVNLSKDSDKYTAVYEVKKNSRSIRAGEDVKYLTNADINEAVYAAMKKAGQEVVDRCQVYMSGERTASELAGHVNKYLHAVDVTIHEKHVNVPKSVKIVVGDLFTCCIATDDLFAMMADWEGMMGLKQKDCHRFYCQCDAKADRSKEMTPYKRSVYTAGRVSIAAENQRIYNKFKALQPLTESLTSEGMTKCLSCLTAIEAAKKKYPAEIRTAVKYAMLWKLWDDYHKNGYYTPKEFEAKDFKEAPEIWKQVDDAYVKELLDYFDALVRKAPQPEWARKDAFVMFANQDTTPKKWKGKLMVRAIYTTYYRTSTIYNDEKSVGWVVEMCTTKGRYYTLTDSVRSIEPWEDEKKPKPKKKGVERLKEIAKPETEEEKAAIKREKSDARIGSSEREQARHDNGKAEPKPAVKTEYTPEFLANVLRETLIKLVA